MFLLYVVAMTTDCSMCCDSIPLPFSAIPVSGWLAVIGLTVPQFLSTNILHHLWKYFHLTSESLICDSPRPGPRGLPVIFCSQLFYLLYLHQPCSVYQNVWLLDPANQWRVGGRESWKVVHLRRLILSILAEIFLSCVVFAMPWLPYQLVNQIISGISLQNLSLVQSFFFFSRFCRLWKSLKTPSLKVIFLTPIEICGFILEGASDIH